jgi:anti-sigma-K factor RskA
VDVSQHREEHLELCAGSVLSDLSESEARELEAHLDEGCPTCDAELSRLSRGARALAFMAPPLRAPAELRGRVLDAVRSEAPGRAPIPLRRPAARRAPIAAWMAAAAAVVVVVLGIMEWRVASRLRRELASSREEIARLNEQIEAEREWAAVTTAPQARVIDLAPTPAGSPQLQARVTYDPATRRAVVTGVNLAAPEGKDYQLWAILKTGPASLGLVRADSQGRALLRLPNAGDPASLAAFAISLERKGGASTATAPEGPVVMVGKLGT